MHAWYFKALLLWKQEKASQYLTPKTPPLHWWDWWYLWWSSLCNICLCSMDCYMSSMGGPEKQKSCCVFFLCSWAFLGICNFLQVSQSTFPDDIRTLTLCCFFMNHMSTLYDYTYSRKGVIQVVNSPGNDYNVVNVKPEGQDSCCKAHTYHTEMN